MRLMATTAAAKQSSHLGGITAIFFFSIFVCDFQRLLNTT